MSHNTMQHLEERLRALEDTRIRCVGLAEPIVCGVCFSVYEPGPIGCLCNPGDEQWMPLGLVIIDLRIRIEDMQQRLWEKERGTNGNGSLFHVEKSV